MNISKQAIAKGHLLEAAETRLTGLEQQGQNTLSTLRNLEHQMRELNVLVNTMHHGAPGPAVPYPAGTETSPGGHR